MIVHIKLRKLSTKLSSRLGKLNNISNSYIVVHISLSNYHFVNCSWPHLQFQRGTSRFAAHAAPWRFCEARDKWKLVITINQTSF